MRQFGPGPIPCSKKHKAAVPVKEQDEEIHYWKQAQIENELADSFARTHLSMKLFILRAATLEQLAVAKDIRFATWRMAGFLTGVTESAIEDLLSDNEDGWAHFVQLYNASGRKGVRLTKAFAPSHSFFPVFECSSATSWVSVAVIGTRHEDKFKDDLALSLLLSLFMYLPLCLASPC